MHNITTESILAKTEAFEVQYAKHIRHKTVLAAAVRTAKHAYNSKYILYIINYKKHCHALNTRLQACYYCLMQAEYQHH